MAASTIDRAAALNPWRKRPLGEKATLSIGMLALAVGLPPGAGAWAVGAIMLAVTFIGARVPFRLWLMTALAPMGFLATGAATLLVSVSSGGIAFAPAGVPVALHLAIRSLAALTCLLFLALTTPVSDMLAGLRRLGLPREIVDIALLTYRFVFLVADQAAAMSHAQDARLGRATRRRWLVSLGLLVANLLPRTLDRARRLETGLAARGWDGEMRVLSDSPKASPSVLIFILALEALVAAAGVHFS
ncbi:cobalt ECF transporter T component CbiQ [Oryzibacter oryziterrae]|uniref:cobalt ECF transporter T component CbiQ n=1 Tax=Oryzibacter oryziterrae TaxID=2766474 RepID=UPI001F007A47|nr:cobalt ECF transporter T component CbiQ [Oryzibacter oryziterrae]